MCNTNKKTLQIPSTKTLRQAQGDTTIISCHFIFNHYQQTNPFDKLRVTLLLSIVTLFLTFISNANQNLQCNPEPVEGQNSKT